MSGKVSTNLVSTDNNSLKVDQSKTDNKDDG